MMWATDSYATGPKRTLRASDFELRVRNGPIRATASNLGSITDRFELQFSNLGSINSKKKQKSN